MKISTEKEYDLQEYGRFIPSTDWTSQAGIFWSCVGEWRLKRNAGINEKPYFNYNSIDEETEELVYTDRTLSVELNDTVDPDPNNDEWINYYID